VVQMHMGKEDIVYLIWRNRKVFPISVNEVPFLE